MKHIAFSIALVTVPSALVLADNYNDNGMKVTQDCGKDKEAVINGSKGTYTFTGACTSITVNGNSVKIVATSSASISVNGNENTITIDAADAIDATGNNNKITYKKGVSTPAPKTSSIGNGNKISKSK